MNMRLLTVILFSVLLSFVVEAIDASVQYRPGEGKTDYRRYRPPSPVSEQSSSVSRQEDQFRSLIEKTVRAKNAVYKNAWSGTSKDLEAVIKKAEQNYGFENTKHLGRNATMLVPGNMGEMRKEITSGNPHGWDWKFWDGWHSAGAKKEDQTVGAIIKSIDSGVEKYVNSNGDEVVYDKATGKIITDEHLGTKNFAPGIINFLTGAHGEMDVDTHRKSDQYKYVGILYERDPNDPDKYYVIDGQTGLPMTPQKVAEMPTTLSDMWKDMGLSCVSNDSEDIVPPKKDSQQNVSTDTPGQKDSNDKLAIGSVVDGQASTNDNSQVGVRGWCHCWDRTALPPLDGNGDVVIPIGLLYAKARVWGNNPLKHEENGSVFTYVLCRKCGKVYKNPDSASRRNKGEDPDFDDMYDIIFYDKHHQATSSARETKELAWQAVDRSARLRSLPDGEIVISGLCGCPKPLTAPVLMSAADGPSVCLICGKICTNPLAERYDR